MTDLHGLAHEIWAASQLMPNEGIEDSVSRIERVLSEEFERNRAAIAELVGALQSAINQVEYMHRKFQETGSGNGFIAQWDQLIAKHDSTTTKEQ